MSCAPAERAAVLDAQALAAGRHRGAHAGPPGRCHGPARQGARQAARRARRQVAVRRLAERRNRSRAGAGRRSGRRQGLGRRRLRHGDRRACSRISRNRRCCWRPRRARPAICARSGDEAGGAPLFAEVVDQQHQHRRQRHRAARICWRPISTLLARDGSADAAARMFRASQALQRPGVAQTQAVLARQLSEGDDDASAMFRLAVSRTREIVRTEAEIARLSTKPGAHAPSDLQNLAAGQVQPRRDARRPDPAAGQARRLSALQGAGAAADRARRSAGRASPGRGLLQDDGDRRSPSLRSTPPTTRRSAFRLEPTAPADGQGCRRDPRLHRPDRE